MPLRGTRALPLLTTGDGAFIEPRGCKPRQAVANAALNDARDELSFSRPRLSYERLKAQRVERPHPSPRLTSAEARSTPLSDCETGQVTGHTAR
jgi:hypothetical protein